MKLSLWLASLVFVSTLCAQQPPSSYGFQSPAPASPGSVSAFVQGSPGVTIYSYWVIAKFPIGNSSPSGPATLLNAPNTLTGGNFVRIVWTSVPNATGYDVIRSSTTALPGSSCTCAVVLSTTGTSVDDTGGALSLYTIRAAPGVNGNITFNNRDFSSTRFTFSHPISLPAGGVFFNDGTAQTTAVLGTCGSNGQVCFNDSGTINGAAGTSWTDSSGVRELNVQGGSNQINSTNGLFGLRDESGNLLVYMNPNSSGTDNLIRTFRTAMPSVSSGDGKGGNGLDFGTQTGGNTTATTNGRTGGGSGPILLQTGNGGSATASTNNNGGSSGSITLITGSGGAQSVANTSNAAGSSAPIRLTVGKGGNATGSGTADNFGGPGGIVELDGGPGGDAAGGATNTGGNGGSLLFKLGSGGTGATANGTDGSLVLLKGSRGNNDLLQVFDNDAITVLMRILASGSLRVLNRATEPVNCSSAVYGAMYFDTTDNRLCVCANDGTDDEWVKSSDYSHATGHCTI